MIEEYKQQRERLLKRSIVKRGYLCRRIGTWTIIHLQSNVEPDILDILGEETVDDILRLPQWLQPISLMYAIMELDPHDLLRIYNRMLHAIEEEDDVRKTVVLKLLSKYASDFKPMEEEQQQSLGEGSNEHVNEKNRMSETATSVLCVVCLSPLVKHEKILELPCKHVYHLNCAEEWLKRSIICPICKKDLGELVD